MANSWFQFQQFRVQQDRCAMKISTDAVLLGGLAQHKSPKNILDIGTGTGVVALMLAQRFPESRITALEIEEDAAGQATENFKDSPFASRLELKHTSLQAFQAAVSFDLIVSNPPYYPNHLQSKDRKRNLALHAASLPFESLLYHASELLTSTGEFWVILPPRQMDEFCKLAEKTRLYTHSKIKIQDSASKPIHREIVSFSKTKKTPAVPDKFLALKTPKGDYAETYRRIVSGFLLGF